MRPNILLITQSTPFPPVTGARQRTSLLFRTLANIGNVDILLQDIGAPDLQKFKGTLQAKYNVVEWVRPKNVYQQITLHNVTKQMTVDPSCSEALKRCLVRKNYDLIVGRYMPSLLRAGAFAYAPIILDIDDMPCVLAEPPQKVNGKQSLINDFAHLKNSLWLLLEKCEALWVTNENDLQHEGLDRAVLLPNIPYSQQGEYCPPEPSGKILFVGALKHTPNIDGLESFISEAWPAIRAASPSARLQIIGYGMSEQCRAAWSSVPGVDCVGYVGDLAPFYRDCAFSLIPVSSGAGTHIKLIESCAFGRTCIVTGHAHRGYERTLADGIALLVAHNMQELAAKSVFLLKNHRVNCSLSFEAWKVAVKNYTFDSFQEIVNLTVMKVLKSSGIR